MTATEQQQNGMTAVALPSRVGQGTAVEQSRAVAEVQAAIVVAQQCPRNIGSARTGMQLSCQQRALAERAFYRFPRGGKPVSGATVHLARELARCWGNVQYGVNELRRDDAYGESELTAWAWDVQTNTRSSQVFIVPHRRDAGGKQDKLVDLRDIYENNANNGARRLREAIFSILPPWFVEEAKEICTATIAKGDGRPIEERIAGAVAVFEAMGVTADRLEQKLLRARAKWTAHDIAQLLVTHKSIQRGEITIDEEFPQARVTASEIIGATAQQPTAREMRENVKVDSPQQPMTALAHSGPHDDSGHSPECEACEAESAEADRLAAES